MRAFDIVDLEHKIHPYIPNSCRLIENSFIFTYNSFDFAIMTYKTEDEVDWSDGTIEPPSLEHTAPVEQYDLSPIADAHDGHNALFASDAHEEYHLPCGLPLNSGTSS